MQLRCNIWKYVYTCALIWLITIFPFAPLLHSLSLLHQEKKLWQLKHPALKHLPGLTTHYEPLPCVIIISASTVVGVSGRFLERLLPQQKIYFEDNYDQALDKARKLVHE